ncbi:M56 family metallopeptidase [Psychroserpens sp.]
MLIYILKSSACLAIFIIFYKLVLENTSVHTFKRFYLLTALGLAFVIPIITFTEYVEPEYVIGTFQSPLMDPIYYPEATIEIPKTNYLPIILWSIYLLGALLFLIKFCFNLYRIISRIRNNTKFKTANFINVLVKNLITPHAFFSYIFFNKHKFENSEIPEEVILHEQTHAKQKHSLDVLVLELLQIVFWFNPLIYLLKKDIKLNHEFLADHAVLKNGIQPSTYQQLLLAFSSSASEPQLANAINYSSIKKRFTVMKTKTSKTSVWFRSLLIFPLIAFTLYGFSQKKEVVKETSLGFSLQESVDKTSPEKDAYYQKATFKFKDTNGTVIATKRYSELTQEEKDRLLLPIGQIKKKSPAQSDLDRWKDSKTYGVWSDGKQINNRLLDTFTPSNFSSFNESKLEKNAVNYGKYFNQVNLYSNIYFNERHKNDAAYLSKNFVVTIIQNDTQESATPEQLAEYNKLAKHYNQQPKEQRIVKLKDLKSLERLYKTMSEEQKENAQPFPECPPTPPTPPKIKKDDHIKTGFIKINGVTHYFVRNVNRTRYYNRKGFEVSKSGKKLSDSQINASDVIPGQYITKVYSNDEVIVEFKKNKQNQEGVLNIPPPKEPKTPKVQKDLKQKKKIKAKKKAKNKLIRNEITSLSSQISQLDYIIDMAKKNALFYSEEKSISSDEAIRLIKNNNNLNILTTQSNSKHPKVNITKTPINLEKTTGQTKKKNLPIPNSENIISHIKVMNRHGAAFYLGKLKITYKEALNYVRKHKNAIVNSSTEKNITVISPPKHEKSDVPVQVNGILPVDDQITLSRKDLLNLKLSVKGAEIKNFKIKVPRKPSQSVSGNTLNKSSKGLIKTSRDGTVIQLFDIKDSEGFVHPPVIIVLSSKLNGVMGEKE